MQTEDQLTVREYARQEGITIQTAYRRIWDGQVNARQILGRWLVSPDSTSEEDDATAALETLPIGSGRSRCLFALRAAIRERIDDPNMSAGPTVGGVA